jgi:hypothetical protein
MIRRSESKHGYDIGIAIGSTFIDRAVLDTADCAVTIAKSAGILETSASPER